VVGAFQSIGTTVGWIYQSQGRTDWMLRWGIVAAPMIVLAMGIGVSFGSIEHVAMAYAIVNLVVLSYPLFAIPGRLIDMRVGEVVRAVSGSFGCALVGAGIAWLISWQLGAHLPLPVLLLLELGAGLGGSLLVARVLDVAAYREVTALLASRRAPALTEKEQDA
jgi:PST family polysaccharide transporter